VNGENKISAPAATGGEAAAWLKLVKTLQPL